jgi:Ankyrin repeats (3 copies)
VKLINVPLSTDRPYSAPFECRTKFVSQLCDAALMGFVEACEYIIKKGADINAQGGYYGNALQTVSFGDDESVVRLLLDRGMDVNAQCGHYGSALHAASSQSHVLVIRSLHERGTDVNPPKADARAKLCMRHHPWAMDRWFDCCWRVSNYDATMQCKQGDVLNCWNYHNSEIAIGCVRSIPRMRLLESILYEGCVRAMFDILLVVELHLFSSFSLNLKFLGRYFISTFIREGCGGQRSRRRISAALGMRCHLGVDKGGRTGMVGTVHCILELLEQPLLF